MAAGYPGSSATFGFGLLPNTSLLPQPSALGTTPWIPGSQSFQDLLALRSILHPSIQDLTGGPSFGDLYAATQPTPQYNFGQVPSTHPDWPFPGVPPYELSQVQGRVFNAAHPDPNYRTGPFLQANPMFPVISGAGFPGAPGNNKIIYSNPKNAAPKGAKQTTGPQGLPPNYLNLGGADVSAGASSTDPAGLGGLTFAQFQKMMGVGSAPKWTDISTPPVTFTPLDPRVLERVRLDNLAVRSAYDQASARLGTLMTAWQNLPSLPPEAQREARIEIAADIADTRASQKQLAAQGRQTANVLNNLAKASANVQMGIGAVVGQNYRAAAQGIAGLGGAVSGALGSQLAQSQAAATANSPIGPPSTMLTPGVPTAGFAPGAAGAVNMIGGTLPAASITQQGRGVLPNGLGGATDYAANLAHIIQGAGQQNALGALAAGNQAAAALEPQIAAARRQFPALSRQILSDLVSARQSQWDPLFQAAGQQNQLDIGKATAIAGQSKDALSLAQSEQTMQTQIAEANAAQAAADARTNATGRLQVAQYNQTQLTNSVKNWLTYQNQLLKQNGMGGLTTSQIMSFSKSASPQLRTWYMGKVGAAQTVTKQGQTTTRKSILAQPLPINRAWQLMQVNYPYMFTSAGLQQVALKLLTTTYNVPNWGIDEVTTGQGPVPVTANNPYPLSSQPPLLNSQGLPNYRIGPPPQPNYGGADVVPAKVAPGA